MEKTVITIPKPTISTISTSDVPRKPLIIADDGHSASILHLEGLLRIGSQFRWAGSLWEIVAFRPHAKAFVAHPIKN